MHTAILLVRVCAEVAGIGDPGTAARAHDILSHVLEQEGLLVVDKDCTETYRIEHHVSATQFEVELIGPTDRASMVVGPDAEPGEVYEQLYLRLRAPAPAPPAPPAPMMPRPPDDAQVDAPSDDASDDASDNDAPAVPATSSHFYVRLGLGGNAASGGGPALGVGWRAAHGSHAFDLSLGAVSSLVVGKAEVLGFRDKAYLGGGLSFGEIATSDASSGIAAEGTAGVMLSKRAFAQADLTIPFYSSMDGYPIAVALSLGLALGGH